uniref:Uncharacterized protein n=1 Tax=Romanomermis culicivorax TaxID=13658 RepID=A0A915J8B7_ROMCU
MRVRGQFTKSDFGKLYLKSTLKTGSPKRSSALTFLSTYSQTMLQVSTHGNNEVEFYAYLYYEPSWKANFDVLTLMLDESNLANLNWENSAHAKRYFACVAEFWKERTPGYPVLGYRSPICQYLKSQ